MSESNRISSYKKAVETIAKVVRPESVWGAAIALSLVFDKNEDDVERAIAEASKAHSTSRPEIA